MDDHLGGVAVVEQGRGDVAGGDLLRLLWVERCPKVELDLLARVPLGHGAGGAGVRRRREQHQQGGPCCAEFEKERDHLLSEEGHPVQHSVWALLSVVYTYEDGSLFSSCLALFFTCRWARRAPG